MSERIAVIGAGTMGSGIAQLAAQVGHTVSLVDVSTDRLDAAVGAIRRSATKLHEKGRLADDADAVLARIQTTASTAGALPHADEVTLALEAVPEDPALKRALLADLARALPAETILATNTSGLPIGELAEGLPHPERVLGLHFFNPPVLMRVVEVVRGPATSDAAFERAVSFVRGLDRDPVRVQRDLPGFVLNRIAMAASNEAIRLVEQGVATPEEVDRGVKGAFGWKMGPLETADLVGLDIVYHARMQIFERTGDARFKPPGLVKKLVDAGKLGRKTGAGFYDYED